MYRNLHDASDSCFVVWILTSVVTYNGPHTSIAYTRLLKTGQTFTHHVTASGVQYARPLRSHLGSTLSATRVDTHKVLFFFPQLCETLSIPTSLWQHAS